MTDEQRAALASVTCRACRAVPGESCTSHSGRRIRFNDVHRVRLEDYRKSVGT